MSDAQNVKNNHDSPVNIGGVTIPPGSTASVPNWSMVKEGHAVKTWLDAEIIETKGSSPSADDDAETAEKQKIVDELATYGVEKTTRGSLANLRKALDEAKADDAAKKAASTGGLPGTTPSLPGTTK